MRGVPGGRHCRRTGSSVSFSECVRGPFEGFSDMYLSFAHCVMAGGTAVYVLPVYFRCAGVECMFHTPERSWAGAGAETAAGFVDPACGAVCACTAKENTAA